MNVLRKIFIAAWVMCSLSFVCGAEQNGKYDYARELYLDGLYTEALTLIQSCPDYQNDPMMDGYAALCALKGRVNGALQMADNFRLQHPASPLYSLVCEAAAYDYFDSKDYEKALSLLNEVKEDEIPEDHCSEYLFKKAYSLYKTGNTQEAKNLFRKVSGRPNCDFTTVSRYLYGYIIYCEGDTKEAQGWFEQCLDDERFNVMASYYIVNCRYSARDYDAVLEKAPSLFEVLPDEQKKHLARIVSESYLVKGDKENAKKFYAQSGADEMEQGRGDIFFSANLKYLTGDWKGAIAMYDKMPEKTDSLGQIARYQTALSYIKLKNKVAALGEFHLAAEMPYDAKMAEDAMFNYAKLSFDLDRNTKGFSDYMKKYSDKVRGNRIYSYMALANLSDKDYQAAIDNYDMMDELEGHDKENYVRANYLRGAQLLDKGATTNAVQCFQAVKYYSESDEMINQLASYGIAESAYRARKYSEAAATYTALYNNSALYGLEQSSLLPFNIAYSHFKAGEWDKASKWFEKYIETGNVRYLKDSRIRIADCNFMQHNYTEAADAYEKAIEAEKDSLNAYPLYQCALSYGLNKKNTEKISLLSRIRENVSANDPVYPQALFELAKTYESEKKPKEAEKMFKALTESVKDSSYVAKATLELGTLERNAGHTEQALAYFKKVIEEMSRFGCSEDALLAIESIYQSKNKPREYLEYLDKIGKSSTKTAEQKEEMIFDSAEQLYFSCNYNKAIPALEEFCRDYSTSSRFMKARYYIADIYRVLDDKEKAVEVFRSVAESNDPLKTKALEQVAALSYSMGDFTDAYDAYTLLVEAGTVPGGDSGYLENRMRSAFNAKMFEKAVSAADDVISSAFPAEDVKRAAKLIKAKSLLSLSSREEAMAVFTDLAAKAQTAEGAEASYLLIKDSFDKGDFEKVKTQVYAFSDSGTPYRYYLAKAFIILGDSFAEEGKTRQAKATYESIASQYAADDDVKEELEARLMKLNEQEQK